MLSGLAKFVIGVIAGIFLFVGATAMASYFLMFNLFSTPAKPVYAEEKPQENASETLEPGAYRARVNWKEGLTLRGAPSAEAGRIQTLPHEQRVVVLTQSADKQWEKVRIEDTERLGWVKAGNTEKVND